MVNQIYQANDKGFDGGIAQPGGVRAATRRWSRRSARCAFRRSRCTSPTRCAAARLPRRRGSATASSPALDCQAIIWHCAACVTCWRPRSDSCRHRRARPMGPHARQFRAGSERRDPLHRRPQPHSRPGRSVLRRARHRVEGRASTKSSPTRRSMQSSSRRRTASTAPRSSEPRQPASTSSWKSLSRSTARAPQRRSTPWRVPASCSASLIRAAFIPRMSGVEVAHRRRPARHDQPIATASRPRRPAFHVRRDLGEPIRRRRRPAR